MTDKKIIAPADVLGAAPQWPKEPKAWDKLVGDSEVVYEDRHVVVFHDPVDEENESARVSGEIRLTLLSKKPGVDTLMDLGVADETLNAAILHGIQQAAYRLGLQKTGFEVRAHIYPPLQHRPTVAFKIRGGRPIPAASSQTAPASASPSLFPQASPTSERRQSPEP
jgi:hypothetical protein